MNGKSTFKYVFWGLLAVVVLLVIMAAYLISHNVDNAQDKKVLIIFLPFFILLAAYVALVGTLVYRDAAKRGMDPWLWATVAVFVPHLIGVILYLVVRHTIKNVCINCGKGIQKDYKICPYCGQKQEMACSNCKKTVSRDWSVCPYCSHPLPDAKGRD